MPPHPDQLDEILKALGGGEVSARALGEESGIHHSTISGWRTGTWSPNTKTLLEVHKALLRIRERRASVSEIT
jgi:transcriptional regulator with XRE-family HTH domain